MRTQPTVHFAALVIVTGSLLAAGPAWACQVCFGAKDAQLTKGLLMGMMSLLFTIIFVLGMAVLFLISFNRRSRLLGGNPPMTA